MCEKKRTAYDIFSGNELYMASFVTEMAFKLLPLMQDGWSYASVQRLVSAKLKEEAFPEGWYPEDLEEEFWEFEYDSNGKEIRK